MKYRKPYIHRREFREWWRRNKPLFKVKSVKIKAKIKKLRVAWYQETEPNFYTLLEHPNNPPNVEKTLDFTKK